MRQICLDTETTGMNPQVDRIVEIGLVEIVDRKITGNHFQCYCNPQMDQINAEAVKVHGLTVERLRHEPTFSERYQDFLNFIQGADETIIHNASFDIGFINAELNRVTGLTKNKLNDYTDKIVDTLVMAQGQPRGQSGNSLDNLRSFYNIPDLRELHGALTDANILAKVYLMMTGGQYNFTFSNRSSGDSKTRVGDHRHKTFAAVKVDPKEISLHEKIMRKIKSGEQLSEGDFTPR